MFKNPFLTFLLFLIVAFSVNGQQLRYTGNTLTGTANALQLNPAFAGSEDAPRITIGSGQSNANTLKSINFSYDQYIKPLKG